MKLINIFLKKRLVRLRNKLEKLQFDSGLALKKYKTNSSCATNIIRFLSIHLDNAENGNYESILWLNNFLISDLEKYNAYLSTARKNRRKYLKIKLNVISVEEKIKNLEEKLQDF